MKIKSLGFVLGLMLAIRFALPAQAANDGLSFYVSVSGDDNNPGTLAEPWRHIQHALNRVRAGSTVYVMNGVYNEKVTFPNSGSAGGGYIVLQNYPGHAPVIDGTGLPISGTTALVTITNKQYIKLIGFEVRNLKAGGVPSMTPIGIYVSGSGAFIEIRNNSVHDIENSCSECGAHGIAVYGRDPNASINNIIIDGNQVYNGKFGWSESMVLNGNVEFFTVSNNIVHDNDNIGIDLIGYEGTASNPAVDRARDGTVVGNLVYNIDSYDNPAYDGERSADGIYVDGGTRILIERNIVHHSDIGVELASEHRKRDTSYITVRNNFIYDNLQVGIAIGGYDKHRGSTQYCTIVNNTLYNNFTQGDWGAELYVQFDTRYNLIKNNILFANAYKMYIESWSAVMTGNVVDNNLYFAVGGGTDGTWRWKNVTYSTFDAYQSGSGNDANGFVGLDPLLMNPASGDLHLSSTGSPAINAGENLHADQMGMTDIDGDLRIFGGRVDIGADELVDDTPPMISVTVSPDSLRPANHQYNTVKATVNISDNLDPSPTLTLISVVSNEPDNGTGDGDTAKDIVIVDNLTFQLRAERSGNGNGRIYTITYQATDWAGNSSLATATVTVPLD